MDNILFNPWQEADDILFNPWQEAEISSLTPDSKWIVSSLTPDRKQTALHGFLGIVEPFSKQCKLLNILITKQIMNSQQNLRLIAMSYIICK